MTRRVLIVGNSDGIGAAVTRALLTVGDEVVGVSRSANLLGGEIFAFAKNNVILPLSPTLYLNGHKAGRFSGDFSRMEFAGATYSPDGRWLFFDVQIPGITFAVTGLWASGSL